MKRVLLLALIAAVVLPLSVRAQGKPIFRGPGRSTRRKAIRPRKAVAAAVAAVAAR
jgi:hypothetical protein